MHHCFPSCIYVAGFEDSISFEYLKTKLNVIGEYFILCSMICEI